MRKTSYRRCNVALSIKQPTRIFLSLYLVSSQAEFNLELYSCSKKGIDAEDTISRPEATQQRSTQSTPGLAPHILTCYSPILTIRKVNGHPQFRSLPLQTGYTRRLIRTRALTGFELVWLTPLGYETHMTHGTEDWRKEGKLKHSLADSCWCANLTTPLVIHGLLRDGTN